MAKSDGRPQNAGKRKPHALRRKASYLWGLRSYAGVVRLQSKVLATSYCQFQRAPMANRRLAFCIDGIRQKRLRCL